MDMESLMEQASVLQEKVAAAQEKLGKSRVKGIAKDGACIIDMSGKYDLLDLNIREDVLSLGAKGAAEVIMAAYQDAKSKADDLIDKVMGEATEGVPMPE